MSTTENPLQEVEGAAVATWDTIKSKLGATFGALATVGATDAASAIGALGSAAVTFGPTLLIQAADLVQTVVSEAEQGASYADIETAVLNKAEADGKADLTAIETDVWQVLIGLFAKA